VFDIAVILDCARSDTVTCGNECPTSRRQASRGEFSRWCGNERGGIKGRRSWNGGTAAADARSTGA